MLALGMAIAIIGWGRALNNFVVSSLHPGNGRRLQVDPSIWELLFQGSFQLCHQEDNGVWKQLTTGLLPYLIHVLLHPNDISGPCEENADLISLDDFVYQGAWRLSSEGEQDNLRSPNYAVGTLGLGPGPSLWLAGHAQTTNIANYALTSPPGMHTSVADLPETGAPSGFVSPIDSLAENPNQISRITGLFMIPGSSSLLVNAENWYDTSNSADTTVFVPNVENIGDARGFYRMSCQAQGAGYMGRIPERWRQSFGGASYYTGWSSVYSINGRYSLGPSLWTFDWDEDTPDSSLSTVPFMNFPFDGGRESWLSERAIEYAVQGTPGPFPPADPLWNELSKGIYGFFVKDSFVVVGSTGGLASGIGYKAVQSDGNVCGGPCSYDPDDNYNYIWLFSVDEILAAGNPSDAIPYFYGIWEVPFDAGGAHRVIGATFDDNSGTLYVALADAGQLGTYDRVPLIVAFSVPL